MTEDLRRYMNILNEAFQLIDEIDADKAEEEGVAWEESHMGTFGPQAASHMAGVIEQCFKRLYPNIPFKAWTDGEGVTASTNSELWDGDMVKPNVFGSNENSHWEATLLFGPLYYMEDGKRYLELLIQDASSGDYKGVWKLIAKQWASWAGSKAKALGAHHVALSMDDDYSGGAWESIASSAGLAFIIHE